jgi:NTP pyrophosphatase (non-canonical NTP hydrolase)
MVRPSDSFQTFWNEQGSQQYELDLDPSNMSETERERTIGDLLRLLYEEATELSRLSPSYKRHLLSRSQIDKALVAEEVADVLKTTLALAQTFGLSAHDVTQAFWCKTKVVRDKAEADRVELERDTKVICVDLDDVLCNMVPFRDVVGGTDVDAPPADKLAAAEKLKERFYVNGGFREMEPVEGASQSMRYLKDLGYTLIVVTARPQWQYKRLYSDTLEWLSRHEIPHDLILFNKDKVEALYEHVTPAWPVVFVEDHERNAKALASVGVRVLLFDQPHNRSLPESENIHRVCGWAEVLENVVKLKENAR